AVLVKLLGTPSYAFTSSTSQTAEGIIKKDDLKFPENFSYQRTETSWNNDSERPDAIFQYEVLNLHGEDAYLRFTIKFPSSGKIAYFGGPCVAN
ncbi:MAG: hypothetical protein ACXWQO_13530, partial [Bdellovibrionota bacterium]